MKIGLARRGYSATGGAEKYLHRLVAALESAGHECVLFAGPQWPQERQPRGGLIPVAGRTPRAFADRLAAIGPRQHCDLLFSLERVWQCDAYRAGDGVHRSWLQRRLAAEPVWRRWLRAFNGKHRQILALEKSMLGSRGAGCVIANSRLVRDEIVQAYDFPAERISVVYNGLPAESAQLPTAEDRAWSRASFELAAADFAVLFAGSGWGRKGLREAITAVGELPPSARAILLVAGRGRPSEALRGQTAQAKSRVRFLGPAASMQPLYAAADLFALPTYYDPFSNACLEALAAGLPVITTASNGFSEIMRPGTDGAILPQPTAIDAFRTALLDWSDTDRRAESRSERAAEAAGFSMEKNVAQTIAALQAAAGAAPPG